VHGIGFAAKPHWILFVPIATAFFACIALFIITAWAVPALMPVGVMAFGACCVLAVWRLPAYFRFRLRVTDRLVSVRTDESGARALSVELGDIESVTIRQTPLGERFGYGDVRIKHPGGMFVVRRVNDPAEFRRRVRNAAFSLQQDIMDNLEAYAGACSN
jgi:uncharacterized membrane protein YdbT with pleckstrin-like domain